MQVDPGGTGKETEKRDGDGSPKETGPTAAEAGAGRTTPPPPEVSTPFTQQVGRGALVILAILFGVFAVFNSQRVDFDWIFGDTSVTTGGGVPLIILLIFSFAVGAAVGAGVYWWRLRVKNRDDEKRRGGKTDDDEKGSKKP